MSAAFRAKFEGQCGACGQWFSKGTAIRYNEESVIVEVDCEEERARTEASGAPRTSEYLPQQEQDMKLGAEEIAVLKAQTCPICFCVHPGECY